MKAKNKASAYTLWALLGPLGAHRFYAGHWFSGLALAALFVPFLLWLPHVASAVSTAAASLATDPATAGDPSAALTAASNMTLPPMGWAGWALAANQAWWLVDAFLLPKMLRATA
jgi:TM2 domain-containing membrane protein YozV